MKGLILFCSTWCVLGFAFSQHCIGVFQTQLNYTNEELGVVYDNAVVSSAFGVFHRTDEADINTDDCVNLNIKKPIIVCEAFDWSFVEGPELIYEEYINRDGDKLGQALRTEGYDIITFNIQEQRAPIQANAIVFAQFIEYINQQKIGNEEIIIYGAGFGGLISRYALLYLEKEKRPHNTRLFISIDVPHKGANIPLSIQAAMINSSILRVLPIPSERMDAFRSIAIQQMAMAYITRTENFNYRPHPYHLQFMQELYDMNNCLGFPQNSKNIALSNGSYSGETQEYSNLFASISGNPVMRLNFDVSELFNLINFSYKFDFYTCPGYDNFALDDKRTCILSSFINNVPQDCFQEQLLNNLQAPLDHLPGSWRDWFNQIRKPINELKSNTLFVESGPGFMNNVSSTPTVSALALNTDDYILDLSSQGKENVLADTPFNDIWWDQTQGNNRQFHLERDELPIDLRPKKFLFDAITSFDLSEDQYSGDKNLILNNVSYQYKFLHFKAQQSIELSNFVAYEYSRINLQAGEIIKFGDNVRFIDTELKASIENINPQKCQLAGNLPSKAGCRTSIPYSTTYVDEETKTITKNQESDLEKISYFPNPVESILYLNIYLENATNIKVSITDMRNKIHLSILDQELSSGNYQFSKDVKILKSGIYLIFIEYGNTKIIEKLIKM